MASTEPSTEAPPIRILTYNIQYSRGKDGVFDLARLADTLRGAEADVIGLQEVTRHLRPTPDQDQVQELATLLPEYYWVYGAPADLDASVVNDDGTILNRRAQFGNMVLSRWPIVSTRLELLPRLRTFDRVALQRGALEAVIDHPDFPLRVYVVHLDHLLERHRIVEIEHLLRFAFEAPHRGVSATGPRSLVGPADQVPPEFVVIGDCNMLPGSLAYEAMTGAPDDFYGRVLTADRLVDTWPLIGREIDDGATWYDEATGYSDGTRLDYVFVSAGLAGLVAGGGIDESAAGSDHQPVWVDLDPSRIADTGTAPDSGGPLRTG